MAILHILSLEKQFIKNQYYLYYKFWKKRSLSYSESVVRNCSIRKIAHKILPKFTCNLIIKETPTQVYFCIVSKFLKKTYVAEHLQMDGFGFWTVSYVRLQNSFHQTELKERKLFFQMYSTGFQHRRTIVKRNNQIRKCNFPLYFLQKSSTWNHSLGHRSQLEMNEWMNEWKSLIRFE